jgi:hypothetical protein
MMENDKCTSHVQQGYNTPLTWGGPHTLWGPPHVRGVLYPCCTCDVRESPLYNDYHIWVMLKLQQVHNTKVDWGDLHVWVPLQCALVLCTYSACIIFVFTCALFSLAFPNIIKM